MTAAAAAKSLQSCLTLCDPIDGTPPGSTVPGILQEKILEWVAISFSRGSSQPKDEPGSSALQADSLLAEPQGNFADNGPSSQSYGFSSSHVWV